jgi:hypothetical protein
MLWRLSETPLGTRRMYDEAPETKNKIDVVRWNIEEFN